MAPRVDKTESAIGGFRATLVADVAENKIDTLVGVSLDAQGRAVIGGSQANIVGVAIVPKWLSKAGQQIDIFKHGEIVDLTGLSAGTRYFMDATGALVTTATGNRYVGHTVEADRLVLSGFTQAGV